jgi:predicted N-acetyltransferase YhbS
VTEIKLVEREMTDAEFVRMNEGFNEHTVRHGNPIESQERFGFVALEQEKFIGCSSGLAYKHQSGYGNWFFLSDLFVESSYRKKGLGAKLLRRLEDKIRGIGVKYIYTWTAGYEAPGFYKKQGYQVFAELENWYRTGYARVGFQKKL